MIKFAQKQLNLITKILWWVLANMIIKAKEILFLLKYVKN
jgi:hypothetical protein